MIDDVGMFMLRTEHDDLGIGIDFHIVTRRPIKQIMRPDRLLLALRIGRGDLAPEHDAPMRALALIAFEPLE
jgi:hypothetical protein